MRVLVSRVLILAMMLYLCLPISNYVYAKENIGIEINGSSVEKDTDIEIINDKVYVPIRNVADLMGLNLEWNDYSKKLDILGHGKTISLVAASDLAIVNNSAVDISQPLKVISDRAFVDMNFICETLGADIGFSGNTYSINIDVPADYIPDNLQDEKINNNLFETAELFSDLTKVKDIAEEFNLSTEWDDVNKSITLTSENGNVLRAVAEDNSAWFNGSCIECSRALKIIDDEAYFDRSFVEKLFFENIPQDYIPAREIAEELGLDLNWNDEYKTLEFIDSKANKLSMIVGGPTYTVNDKTFDNAAPLMIKDDIAMTNKAVIAEAFENVSAEMISDFDTEIFAAASNKVFKGQITLEKAFSSPTYIDISVISVHSYIYYGNRPDFDDVNTTTVVIPANTKNVDFSVTKTNCNSSYTYIVGYEFYTSNSYYETSGYISNNTTVNSYYYAKEFSYHEDTSALILSPKILSNAVLDDKIFSGVIRTNNNESFGQGSSLTVSVRSATYLGTESIISSTILYPENNKSISFSIAVPNNSTTRNSNLYLRYDLYNGNPTLFRYGYFAGNSSSTKQLSNASILSLSEDNSNLDFRVISADKKIISGIISLPNGVTASATAGISFDIHVMSVRYNVYSGYDVYINKTYPNAAKINYNQNSTNYSILADLYDDEYYIFKYTMNTPQIAVQPFGYSTYSAAVIDPNDAKQYKGSDNTDNVNFYIPYMPSDYTYIDQLPFSVSGYLTASSPQTSNGRRYQGYYLYLKKGQILTIDLTSDAYITRIELYDDDMSLISYTSGSQIVWSIEETGFYYIHAGSQYSYTTGAYNLKVKTDDSLSCDTIFTDINDMPIENIGDNNTIISKYIIKNIGSSENLQLYMVAYDKNGCILNVKKKQLIADEYTTTTDYLVMNLLECENITTIKTFVWTDELTPVCSVKKLPL